ncbi:MULTISPECIES: dTMP kinase [Peptoniphilus]|jgi:dTMP kinase|uniref:dTMP kinase n=2 Tax=Peptoniphilaceae TaxID=1570339 RepID=UPI00028951C9|nr:MULTISPECIES: dTMP kinase [Peptoniphilus]MBS6610702.1 dTMP kinase [Peptoniphilus harei]MDU1042903.1 dTMP kinase [Peptoniphilus rhinitidis]MDU1954346.1 dTMP kinase [Peptoniphilus lacydonensis]MDU2109177.1 dTMP kinase [Peptoniphilus lacydonensis]MDU2115076.1 dTMP kinase [Peptoniphilus lacydonensis]
MSAFITFEGPDGSGKSTIANLVYEEILKKNKKVLKTREPGGTRISEKIRELILDKDLEEMDKRTEALLYSAARAQHTYEKIVPALRDSYIVLCERYVLSSLAYQGFARGQDLEDIMAINNFATGNIKPDIVFIFRTDKKTLLRKDKNSYDRLERESDEFHKKVREYYNNLEKEDNFYFIDVSKSIEEVFCDCMKVLKERMIV